MPRYRARHSGLPHGSGHQHCLSACKSGHTSSGAFLSPHQAQKAPPARCLLRSEKLSAQGPLSLRKLVCLGFLIAVLSRTVASGLVQMQSIQSILQGARSLSNFHSRFWAGVRTDWQACANQLYCFYKRIMRICRRRGHKENQRGGQPWALPEVLPCHTLHGLFTEVRTAREGARVGASLCGYQYNHKGPLD